MKGQNKRNLDEVKIASLETKERPPGLNDWKRKNQKVGLALKVCIGRAANMRINKNNNKQTRGRTKNNWEGPESETMVAMEKSI